MVLYKRLVALCLLFGLAACVVSPPDQDWQLDASQSRVEFVSVKNEEVVETHHFNAVNGSIAGQEAHIEIPLGSVDTGIAIRDERMQKLLFEVSRYALLSVQATLPKHFASDASGLNIDLNLDLHGVKKVVRAKVNVELNNDGSLQVTTAEPIVVKAQDFALTAGIDKLREVAGLKHIAYEVPVSFSLRFDR